MAVLGALRQRLVTIDDHQSNSIHLPGVRYSITEHAAGDEASDEDLKQEIFESSLDSKAKRLKKHASSRPAPSLLAVGRRIT